MLEQCPYRTLRNERELRAARALQLAPAGKLTTQHAECIGTCTESVRVCVYLYIHICAWRACARSKLGGCLRNSMLAPINSRILVTRAAKTGSLSYLMETKANVAKLLCHRDCGRDHADGMLSYSASECVFEAK